LIFGYDVLSLREYLEYNMEIIGDLIHGFVICFQPLNLFSCFIGVLIGTLIGVLPGIGPVGAISILLPITYGLGPVSAIIMLAGIYYGAMYGGSTTSILVNIPGEAASVVTCLDGYQMARKGRAGPALGISAFGSFIAGTISIFGLILVANPLASIALRFGPPEYFSLMCLGLTLVICLAQFSVIKALIMATVGIFLSTVGLDEISGTELRFTFGITQLMDGINIVPLVMGLFGISEVLINIEKMEEISILGTISGKILPTLRDWIDSTLPILRGTVIGFFLGILPGGGAIISSFVSYTVEKKVSKHSEAFGTGRIEGVAGPEAANNAAAEGSLVPLFSLGIPSNVVMALLFGALMLHGLQPGPKLIIEHPEIFWGVVASLYLGNIMLLILNLPLIGLWIKILKVPYHILFPLIILFCMIGSYSINNSLVDVQIMIFFGLIGYLLRKLGYELAPLVLSFVLGPIFERTLRQSLLMSGGSFLIFITRPIASVGIFSALLLIFVPLVLKALGRKPPYIPVSED
jgi:putative tricarboxylic transport membrane protein